MHNTDLVAHDVNANENIRAEKRLRTKKSDSFGSVEKFLKSKLSM